MKEPLRRGLEVDSHEHAPLGRPAHLGEAGIGENAASTDVRGPDEGRVTLECTGTTLSAEVDSGAGKGPY